jgi:hypothetical protein
MAFHLGTPTRRTLAIVRTTWFILGLSLLLLLALDALAAIYYHIQNWSSTADRRWTRDAFLDAPWIREFLTEHRDADALDWHSYVYWRHKRFKGHYINVDSRGVRATWQAPMHPDAKPIRVFMLGGSTMWGTGARDDFTIPSLLAKRIADKAVGRPVEITNFGELGYVSTQELLTLELELQRGNIPDAVICYDGANDLGSAFQGGEAGIPQNETNRRVDFERPGAAFVYSLMKNSSLLRPVLWRMARGVWTAENTRRSVEERSNLGHAALRVYTANLAIIDGLSRDFGFSTLFLWQPVIFSKLYLSPGEQDAANESSYMREFFLQGYDYMRKDTQLRANPHFHDISEIFDSIQQPIYFDLVHVTEHGNEMVAQAMLPYVRELLDSLNGVRK